METALTPFAKRLFELRKARNWSQPELATKVGTSGPIIGRYERGEMTPSVQVARNLAEVLGVTLDFLCNEGGVPDVLQDKGMLDRLNALASVPGADREHILYVIDGLIRDAKARMTYGKIA